MKNTYQTGLSGEKMAAEWLREHHGMRLLAHRYRNSAGEIDLIMLDRETVAFIEVKTRMNAAPGSGMLAVDMRKQRRIARAAQLFLMGNGWLNRSVRFDVAEVTCDGVFYVANAFQPGGMFYR